MHNKLIISLMFSFLLSQDYPVLGSSQSLDFMTWNVENYPKHNQTNSYMIDIFLINKEQKCQVIFKKGPL